MSLNSIGRKIIDFKITTAYHYDQISLFLYYFSAYIADADRALSSKQDNLNLDSRY